MANRTGGRRRSYKKQTKRQWRRMDLHLHTPASSDYKEPNISYLDILRQAVVRGLDIIALTDHNTVAGFAAMQKEVEQLLWLEEMKRIQPDEQRKLEEYRRLLEKVLVLPGFEFTATFGFHILGIFPPDTTVSYLEHLLLTLNVPADQLRKGSSVVGATSDVLTAYQVINDAGGLVIAAHANSGNGVGMRGLDFGGQTRIAYTQDPNLHVLEVTDLEKNGRYTTRRFFSGSKPEYPRPMRCIQGSDAHRLVRESANSKNLGIGERVTEISLEEVSFDALANVLKGTDLARTRPYRGPAKPVDFVQYAREEGESIVQAFHASMAQRGGHLTRILQDICGMANTNGGTIYIGLAADPKQNPVGVREPDKAIDTLHEAISNQFSPEPVAEVDSLSTQGKRILRISVQPGSDLPYAIDSNQFYVRDDSDTNIAVRDEIVRLVERGLKQEKRIIESTPAVTAGPTPSPSPTTNAKPAKADNGRSKSDTAAPRTGVEIVSSEKRKGVIYHTLRDLRNGNLIKNVTKTSARKLWHYAILQTETKAINTDKLKWKNDMFMVSQRKKGDNVWYDLALREKDGVRMFYGVTDSGMNEVWLKLVQNS